METRESEGIVDWLSFPKTKLRKVTYNHPLYIFKTPETFFDKW